ncbi:MAG: sortase [Actinomycetota bacterium]
MAGYLLWMLWGTNFVTDRAQAELREEFDTKLEHPTPPPSDDDIVRVPGSAVAKIVIPRMDLDMIVVDGTSTQDLERGPGLYPDSRLPWQPHGRVAIAGHRTTYKAPFWDLDKLGKGDKIQLQTEHGTFDYRVYRTETVAPTAVQVADPDATVGPTLVLTTCTPRFSAEQRLVVFAQRT